MFEIKILNLYLNIDFYLPILLHVQCDAIRWNNFCGDVASDSFNKTSRDEDNTLDQIRQICMCYYHDDFNSL